MHERGDQLNIPAMTAARKIVDDRLDMLGIKPHENLGQHFLINDKAIDVLAQSVSPGNKVLEIGAGIGQLTEALAQNATKVVAVEIDRRYEPVLSDVENRHPNVQVIYGDALALRLQDLTAKEDGNDTQIVASIPYHITEPFMRRIVDLDIESATMVVGQKLAESIQAVNEDSLGFGKLTLLAQSFYDLDVLMELDNDSFSPSPRTKSSIIRLTPKGGAISMREFLLRKLFRTSKQNPPVRNVLKEGLTEFTEFKEQGMRSKKERNKLTRRNTRFDLRRAAIEYNQAEAMERNSDTSKKSHLLRTGEKAIVEGFGIPNDILGQPFDRLSNSELRILSSALRGNDR